ncbi:MAG: autotransporter domain-containing protein [Deltaproteobacteria bacterium]|nr:autotransporter domain-containing protein [Deltaproteobacteria bacterium]
MVRSMIRLAAGLLAAVLALPGLAGAGDFSQFVGLGDSTIDTGYFRYHSIGFPEGDQAIAAAIARGAKGGWAGNGVMNTTMLADRFSLSAATIDGGGANYGVGGSYTAMAAPDLVPATQQITNYLASVGGRANPDALYIVSTGNNDLLYVTRNPAPPDYLHQQVTALAAKVAELQRAGARTILVPNSYYGATLAGPGGVLPADQVAAYQRVVANGLDCWRSLTAAGVHYIPADHTSVFQYVIKNPTKFGFTAESVLSANAPSPVPAILAILTPEQHQEYLFIDGHHLTTAGQTIVADYNYSLLTAPSQISLITEGAVQGGLSRTATIQSQIDLSGQHRGPNGVNVWTSAGAKYQKIKNAAGYPDDSGVPFGGSVGVDYLAPGGIIVGAAFTAGGQRQSFSTGGHFGQVEEALSLYAAYRYGPAWVNAVATYGMLQEKIVRQVPLGRYLDENEGDTDGQSQTLALRGGGDIRLGPVTTGPVAGLVCQKIWLDGFTESGGSGLTALSFGDITRDSEVSQLGWRAAVELGAWRPFAEALWNHEWAARDRTGTASLTTVDAPAYTADAAPVAADWGTVTLGSSYQLNPRVTLLGQASAVVWDPEVITYGGELGVSINF